LKKNIYVALYEANELDKLPKRRWDKETRSWIDEEEE